MNDVEFRELFKLAVEKLKDDSVYRLLQFDAVYQEDSERESEAEAGYMHLDLTEEQREICNRFIEVRERQELEYGTHAYIAGLHDAFRIMAVLFPEKWNVAEIREVIFNKA